MTASGFKNKRFRGGGGGVICCIIIAVRKKSNRLSFCCGFVDRVTVMLRYCNTVLWPAPLAPSSLPPSVSPLPFPVFPSASQRGIRPGARWWHRDTEANRQLVQLLAMTWEHSSWVAEKWYDDRGKKQRGGRLKEGDARDWQLIPELLIRGRKQKD